MLLFHSTEAFLKGQGPLKVNASSYQGQSEISWLVLSSKWYAFEGKVSCFCCNFDFNSVNWSILVSFVSESLRHTFELK